MRFTWGEAKRESNLAKHGFDFADAETVFSGATFTLDDDRFVYGERRFITLGMLRGMVVVIAHTEQEDALIRIISMRKATKHEQRIYFQGFSN